VKLINLSNHILSKQFDKLLTFEFDQQTGKLLITVCFYCFIWNNLIFFLLLSLKKFSSILCFFADAICENHPRVIDDSRARKLASDLKKCWYYETCATYGLNVERVFQDGKKLCIFMKLYFEVWILSFIVCQKLCQSRGSRPTTPIQSLSSSHQTQHSIAQFTSPNSNGHTPPSAQSVSNLKAFLANHNIQKVCRSFHPLCWYFYFFLYWRKDA